MSQMCRGLKTQQRISKSSNDHQK